MRFTVLNENRVSKRGLTAEHGLSLWIEHNQKKYLFDVGQTDCYLKNADKLGIDVTQADAVIISHGHYDHCGGLEYWGEREKLPPIYVGEGAFERKYCLNPDKKSYREIGVLWKKTDESICVNRGKLALDGKAALLCKIPYTVAFEEPSAQFWIGKNDTYIEDKMADEQILALETKKGLAVFCGCAHAGIINCLEYVRKEFPNQHIHLLFAGMHLKGCSEEHVTQVIHALSKYKIDIIMPVHCTGMEVICRIKEAFGKNCMLMETGKSYSDENGFR